MIVSPYTNKKLVEAEVERMDHLIPKGQGVGVMVGATQCPESTGPGSSYDSEEARLLKVRGDC